MACFRSHLNLRAFSAIYKHLCIFIVFQAIFGDLRRNYRVSFIFNRFFIETILTLYNFDDFVQFYRFPGGWGARAAAGNTGGGGSGNGSGNGELGGLSNTHEAEVKVSQIPIPKLLLPKLVSSDSDSDSEWGRAKS